MSESPPVSDAPPSPSPADDVDRVFHGFMGHHHPGLFHYPAQNPYLPDYYGGESVYYPHHHIQYNQGFRLKNGLADPTGYGGAGAGPDPYAYGGHYGSAGAAASYPGGGGGGHYSASGGGGGYGGHSAGGYGGGGGGGHPTYHAPVVHSSPPVTHSRSHKSSKSNATSMSALTLLAFLFFLNILQSCLKEHMMAMNPTVMVMTAGTANRQVAAKLGEDMDDMAGAQDRVDSEQLAYGAFPSSDVKVDDKIHSRYEDFDGLTFNKTIQAKLVHIDDAPEWRTNGGR